MIAHAKPDIYPGASPRWGIERMRLESLERVLVVAEVLNDSRRGMTVPELRSEVCERMGTTWCKRSIYRTLQLLERMGLVESKLIGVSGRGGLSSVWRYTGRALLPEAHREPAISPEVQQLRDVNELLRAKLRDANEQIRQLQARPVAPAGPAPPPPVPPTRPSKLSGRQRQILPLLEQGLTTSEIAERLGMTPSTVNTHLYRIRKRASPFDRH